MANFALLVHYLRPGSEWFLTSDDDYQTLVWLSASTKPTLDELLAVEEDAVFEAGELEHARRALLRGGAAVLAEIARNRDPERLIAEASGYLRQTPRAQRQTASAIRAALDQADSVPVNPPRPTAPEREI